MSFQYVFSSDAGPVGQERSCDSLGYRPLPFVPPQECSVEQSRTLSVGQEFASEPDQTARRDFKLHPHPFGPVIHHLRHTASPLSERFGYDADEGVGTIDHCKLYRLKPASVFLPGDDFGF